MVVLLLVQRKVGDWEAGVVRQLLMLTQPGAAGVAGAGKEGVVGQRLVLTQPGAAGAAETLKAEAEEAVVGAATARVVLHPIPASGCVHPRVGPAVAALSEWRL